VNNIHHTVLNNTHNKIMGNYNHLIGILIFAVQHLVRCHRFKLVHSYVVWLIGAGRTFSAGTVFIVHKYRPVRYFDVGRPRAISSTGGSVGV